MITSGLRLSGLRRAILSALSPGSGESADELRRRVALERGLSPGERLWPSFNTSFSRALRRLEELGVLEIEREPSLLFDRACARSVRLTQAGERERARLVARGEQAFWLEPLIPLPSWERLLAQASEPELERLSRLVAAERGRRASGAFPEAISSRRSP